MSNRATKRRAAAPRVRSRPRAAGKIKVSRPDALIRMPWQSEAGVFVTSEEATKVAAVYGCCRLIVDNLASAPIRVSEISGSERKTLPDDPASYILNHSADVSQAPDAPTAQSIEEALYWSALLTGNGYAEIQRDLSGKFFALWPLEPDRVIPRRDETGYWYEVSQPEGGSARLEARNCFHVRGPSLFGYVGDSTVYRAAKAIGIASAAQAFSASYFANGTVLAGVLKFKGKMTPEQKKRLGEQWRGNWSGSAKAYGVPVLDQDLQFELINHDAQKSQLVEARRFQVQEIARFFGVPTTLLADTESWTNLSELYDGFYRNSLRPWAERFDAEATRKLFPQRAPWREVEHDFTSLRMGTESFKRTVESLRAAVNGGLKTRNEARDILGDNSLGSEGDEMVVEGAIQTLETVLEGPPEVAAPAPAKAAGPAEEPDEDDGETEAPGPVPMPNRAKPARAAVALDRYARRMQARKTDLERNAPDKVAENLTAERTKLLPGVIEECRQSAGDLAAATDFDMRVMSIAEAVESGEPAHLAAERLLGVA